MLSVERGIPEPVLPGAYNLRKKEHTPTETHKSAKGSVRTTIRLLVGCMLAERRNTVCRWEFADAREIVF